MSVRIGSIHLGYRASQLPDATKKLAETFVPEGVEYFSKAGIGDARNWGKLIHRFPDIAAYSAAHAASELAVSGAVASIAPGLMWSFFGAPMGVPILTATGVVENLYMKALLRQEALAKCSELDDRVLAAGYKLAMLPLLPLGVGFQIKNEVLASVGEFMLGNGPINKAVVNIAKWSEDGSGGTGEAGELLKGLSNVINLFDRASHLGDPIKSEALAKSNKGEGGTKPDDKKKDAKHIKAPAELSAPMAA